MERPEPKQLGPYNGWKHGEIKSKFETFLATSHYPEDFEGLAPLSMKPDPERDYAILKKYIGVRKEKRDCTFIPCHTCGIPKFYEGGYLVVDEFGWLFLIGPDCGDKHFRHGSFADAEKKFDREEAEKAAYEYLLKNVDLLPELRRYARQHIPVVEAAFSAYQSLHSNRSAVLPLRQALSKRDGVLEVVDMQLRLQSNGDMVEESVFVPVAQITGKTAVAAEFRMLTQLNECVTALDAFGDDEESTLETFVEAERNCGLPELQASVMSAISGLLNLRGQLADFRSFFDEENFEQIRIWADDPRNGDPLDIACTGTIRGVNRRWKRKSARFDIATLYQPLPRPPRGI